MFRGIKPRPRVGAFTLVELMVVIAIIGVLASIAIPAFKGYIHRSKTTEAAANIKSLYIGAAAYYQRVITTGAGTTSAQLEHCVTNDATPSGAWANVSEEKQVVDWASQTSLSVYEALNFKPSDPLYFAYYVIADGIGGCSNSASDTVVYTMGAQGDMDGDGDITYLSVAVGTNENNTLYHASGINRFGDGFCSVSWARTAATSPMAMWLIAAGLLFVRRRHR